MSEILRRLEDLAATYRTGRFPDLGDPLTLRLFNTYRFYLYPQAFPMPLTAHRDERGSFFETAQVLGGASQSSFSTTEPGVTRGNHFHLRKVERFVVVQGRARIDIRPVWGGPVASFDVSGEIPRSSICQHSTPTTSPTWGTTFCTPSSGSMRSTIRPILTLSLRR